jgi:ankyrin repeat protein
METQEELDSKSILTKRRLLFDASLMEDLDTVELLLKHGVEPNYVDPKEGTPLMVAIKKKNYQLIESISLIYFYFFFQSDSKA